MAEDKIITIPLEYTRHFHGSLIAMRGLNNSIYLYSKEDFKKVNEQIDKNIQKHSLNYPQFKEFLLAGTVESKINEAGEITVPGFLYEYLGTDGQISFKKLTNWLEVKRRGPTECSCNDPLCAKCLSVNCRNTECTVHTQESKRRYAESRTEFKIDNKSEK